MKDEILDKNFMLFFIDIKPFKNINRPVRSTSAFKSVNLCNSNILETQCNVLLSLPRYASRVDDGLNNEIDNLIYFVKLMQTMMGEEIKKVTMK